MHEEDHAISLMLKDVDSMLLDCDGVLWKGSELISGSREALEVFQAEGKKLLFITNNSSKSRTAYCSKFKSLGLDVHPNQIISSSYAAAAFLQSISFKKKAFVIGNQGLEDEFRSAGIDFIGGSEAVIEDDLGDMSNISRIKVDPDIGFVVVGWDPLFSYAKLVYASICLHELQDCQFICTNSDSFDSIGGGRMMPGTGCILAAVETASNRKALVVGKEGPWLLTHLKECYGVKPESSVMIGDRLDTDIKMGRRGGMKTALVLSGVSTKEDSELAIKRGEGPDLVVMDLSQLARGLLSGKGHDQSSS